MIGFGLVGAGRIGALHARNVARGERTRLVCVFDPAAERARSVAADGGASVAACVDEILSSDRVDAVAVCSPTDTHVELIERAASAGKAVFCEKPIDLDIRRVRECVRRLEERPVPFAIGFHRRFDPHHLALRGAVRSGEVGEVEQIRMVSRDPGPPPIEYVRRSGGIFRDMMIHDLDQMRFLLDRPPVGVFARGEAMIEPAFRDAGDYDSATAVFWAANGATVVIQNSRRATYGFDQRVEIFGSRGTIAMDNVPSIRTTISDGDGYRSPKLPEHFPQRYADAYRNEIEAFAAAVESGRPPAPGAEDAMRALHLADCALLSARTGRAVAIEDPETAGEGSGAAFDGAAGAGIRP